MIHQTVAKNGDNQLGYRTPRRDLVAMHIVLRTDFWPVKRRPKRFSDPLPRLRFLFWIKKRNRLGPLQPDPRNALHEARTSVGGNEV